MTEFSMGPSLPSVGRSAPRGPRRGVSFHRLCSLPREGVGVGRVLSDPRTKMRKYSEGENGARGVRFNLFAIIKDQFRKLSDQLELVNGE